MASLIGINTEYRDEVDGIIRRHTQEIPQSFLDELADNRFEMRGKTERDLMRVASVPTVIIEQWMREGFNAYKAPVREVKRRLWEQNLEHFIATDKRI